jgi:RimJ/RimL family protein N-acetyltransferase/catechol 2,3-dioxygenase-like lactoylglutathione lyase family enzyme
MRPPDLSTERLRLRALRVDDAEALHPAWSDPETLRYWHRIPRTDLRETEAVLHQMVASEAACEWAICEAGSDTAIGHVGLMGARRGRRAAFGYLLRKEHWGRGYAAEASHAALRHGFGALGLAGTELWIYRGNTRSVRVAEKLGCTVRGQFVAFNVERREALRVLVYGISAAEFGAADPARDPVGVYGVEPVIESTDVEASIRFYCERLGFGLDWRVGEPALAASVSRGDWTPLRAVLRFVRVDAEPAARPGALAFGVEDVDRLCAEFRTAGAQIEEPPEDKPYGLREFSLRDCHGHRLRFAGPPLSSRAHG